MFFVADQENASSQASFLLVNNFGRSSTFTVEWMMDRLSKWRVGGVNILDML